MSQNDYLDFIEEDEASYPDPASASEEPAFTKADLIAFLTRIPEDKPLYFLYENKDGSVREIELNIRFKLTPESASLIFKDYENTTGCKSQQTSATNSLRLVEKRRFGTIKFFSREKKMGFLFDSSSGEEIYFSVNSLDDSTYKNLKQGDQVKYDLFENQRGRRAHNVRIVQQQQTYSQPSFNRFNY